eukprot:1602789-Pleurochrysis_carterae.AAC.1
MMDAMLLKGLPEASLTEFNSLHHSFTRLNRSLPAHARLGDALIAEKTLLRRSPDQQKRQHNP